MKKTLIIMSIAIFVTVMVFQPRLCATEKSITNNDIISMVKAGLSDAIIMSLIQESIAEFAINPTSLAKLKKAGVSEGLIKVIISACPSSDEKKELLSISLPTLPEQANVIPANTELTMSDNRRPHWDKGITDGHFKKAMSKNVGKVGIGFQENVSDDSTGFSVRCWVSDNFGLGVNFYSYNYDRKYENPTYDYFNKTSIFTGKLLYAPIVKSNSKFYLGIEAGYGETSSEDYVADIVVVNPLIGGEYFFSIIPKIGFDWEVGYRHESYVYTYTNPAGYSKTESSESKISAAIGAHYYF